MDRVHCTLSRVACDVEGVLVRLLLDSYFSWDVVFLSFACTFLYNNAMFLDWLSYSVPGHQVNTK